MAQPQTHSTTQILLHWGIVLLVVFQFIMKDGIVRIWDDRMSGAIANVATPNPHVIVGTLVLVLMVWRLVLRTTRGVPALPDAEGPAMQKIALGVHYLLYALIILLPVSGLAAWLGGIAQPAAVHTVLKTVLLATVIIHAGGALAQHFWYKTNVLKRMLGLK